MKVTNQPLPVRVLLAFGLLMTTMPLLLREFVNIPDFFRGFLAGLGLGLEVIALVIMARNKRKGVSC